MSAIDTAYSAALAWIVTHPREFELLRDGSVAAALFALLVLFSLKACGPKTVNPLEEALGTVNAEVVLLKEVLTTRQGDVEKLRGEMTNLLSKVLNVLHLRGEDIKKLREELRELDKNASSNTQHVLDEMIETHEAIQKESDSCRDELSALKATVKGHVSKDALKEALAPLRDAEHTLQAQVKAATDDIQQIMAWLWVGCAERAPTSWRSDTFYRDHPDITAPLLNSLSGAILLGPDKLSIQTALTYIPHTSRKHWASTNMRAIIEHSFPGPKAVL